MTIEKVIQIPDRDFSPSNTDKEGSRVFVVFTDDAETEEQDILAATDPVSGLTIPVVGDAWNSTYTTTVVQDYNITDLDEGFARSVTVNYSDVNVTKADPTEDAWEITITEENKTLDLRQEPIQVNNANRNVENSAGDAFQVAVQSSDVVITIQRKISPDDWDDKDIHLYKKSMNEGQVTINGVSYKARQLFMSSISTSASVLERNGIEYLDQTLVIKSLPETLIDQNGLAVEPYGWVIKLLNAGLREFVGGKLVEIATDAKTPTTVPWPLKLDGTAIRPVVGSDGLYDLNYKTFFLYRETDWSGLNLE